MALPELTWPPGVPTLVVASQDADESDVYAPVKMASGHSRSRRIRTIPERRVKVATKSMTQLQTSLLDGWYENALDVGSRPFSVPLSSNIGVGNLWWSAMWVAKPVLEPSNGRWVGTGELVLSGEGSVTPPVSTSLFVTLAASLAAASSIQPDLTINVRFRASLTPDLPLNLRLSAALTVVGTQYLLIGDGRYMLIGDGRRLSLG